MRHKVHRGQNRHHKIPKIEWWTMHYDNLLVMNKHKHRALHILFDENWKATMPHRQIEIYLWMMWKAIIKDAREDIQNILDDYWIDLYNPRCISN